MPYWLFIYDIKREKKKKKGCFQIVEKTLKKTLESPLDSKKIKPVNPKSILWKKD